MIKKGLPFEVKISDEKPLSLSDLTDSEFDKEMLKAHSDFENGRIYSFEELEEDIRKETNSGV